MIGAFQKVVIADNIAGCVDALLKPGASVLTKKIRKKYKKKWGGEFWREPLMVAVTLEWVCLGCLFFHAEDLCGVGCLLMSVPNGHC